MRLAKPMSWLDVEAKTNWRTHETICQETASRVWWSWWRPTCARPSASSASACALPTATSWTSCSSARGPPPRPTRAPPQVHAPSSSLNRPRSLNNRRFFHGFLWYVTPKNSATSESPPPSGRNVQEVDCQIFVWLHLNLPNICQV